MAELTVLDVGHGSATVVTEDGHTAVIDAGPGTALLEYLTEAGIQSIDLVLISHADADHLKGLVGLLGHGGFSISKVIVNSDAAKESKQWHALAWELDHRERSGELAFNIGLVEGDVFELAGNVTLEVAGPRRGLVMLGPGQSDEEGRRIKSNTISAVVRVSLAADMAVLVAGDIDEVGLDHLLSTNPPSPCHVLVFPHHGGNVDPTATVDRNQAFATRLMEIVRPDTVIFSTGRNSHVNPRPEIIDAIRRAGDSYIMCTQMSKHCSAEIGVVSLDHLEPAFSAGRRDSLCCAGTIAVTPVEVSPSRGAHSTFVESTAPTAMCRRTTLPG